MSKKHLVVVESPAKAKTINKYLGGEFTVMASVGHIRDLPDRDLGIQIEKGYEPDYVVSKGKGDVVKKLRAAAEDADRVYIATDPDREGEAIAWHIASEMGPKAKPKISRVLFHEITPSAVKAAIAAPRQIDQKLFEAQQARRVMDRLVGYKVSPFLWKTVYKGLSAGRVQSVALRLLAEREQEIRDFKPVEYWSVEGTFETAERESFTAKLSKILGKKAELTTESGTRHHVEAMRNRQWRVSSVEKKGVKRNPSPPFITSSLQQEAANRLHLSAKKIMMLAQQLYEGVELGDEGQVGLITYMRTDSVRLADSAVEETRALIESRFGKRSVPAKPRSYKTKGAAQDAHEAIRPTVVSRTPAEVRRHLPKDLANLYELIWNRTVASQMASAEIDQTVVEVLDGQKEYLFRAQGQVITFPGYLAVYHDMPAEQPAKGKTVEDTGTDDEPVENTSLPKSLKADDPLRLTKLEPRQHFTKPPPRFSEASLVKQLDTLGIGRPSTYASILTTLTDRGYAELKARRFWATDLGMDVNRILVQSFPELFNVQFTAQMEGELDKIAEGQLGYVPAMDAFYKPFTLSLDRASGTVQELKRDLFEETDEVCPTCGAPMRIRWGRNGKFLSCSRYPECKTARNLPAEGESAAVGEGATAAAPAKAAPEPTGITCEKCGQHEMVLRQGRFGPFLACSGYPKCKNTRPVAAPDTPVMTCPKCKEGQVLERRSKRGKVFYGCNRYPKCDFASWDKPVMIPCDACGNPWTTEKVTKTGTVRVCPECKHTVEMAPSAPAPTAAA